VTWSPRSTKRVRVGPLVQSVLADIIATGHTSTLPWLLAVSIGRRRSLALTGRSRKVLLLGSWPRRESLSDVVAAEKHAFLSLVKNNRLRRGGLAGGGNTRPIDRVAAWVRSQAS
jgi:hypothetical protein